MHVDIDCISELRIGAADCGEMRSKRPYDKTEPMVWMGLNIPEISQCNVESSRNPWLTPSAHWTVSHLMLRNVRYGSSMMLSLTAMATDFAGRAHPTWSLKGRSND